MRDTLQVLGETCISGEEYEDLNISYKPISNFGIGFLSSFMVCQEIDVKTKYYLDNSEGLKLHIPNYDGCFFIELESDAYVGTEIKLYLNSSIDDKSIVDYIQKVMQDIKYTINIRYLEEQKEKQFVYTGAIALEGKMNVRDYQIFCSLF